MAFDKENLKILFIQQFRNDIIRYISPDMESPVFCIYKKFLNILSDSKVIIIKSADFIRELNSFNVIMLDLMTGEWKIVEPNREMDTRTIYEKFEMDKKMKEIIRNKDGKDKTSKIYDNILKGIKSTKDKIFNSRVGDQNSEKK
jgi:hypothetical protein